MKIFGLDISPDHGGIVCLNEDGIVEDWCFLTTTKKYVGVDSKHGILLSKKQKDESKDRFRLRRMGEFERNLVKQYPTFFRRKSAYFSFEGYSYASQSTSLCQIAELTGYLKYLLFKGGGKLRIHEPTSVKLFATNKGNASKKEVAVKALLNFDVPEGLIQKTMVKKKGKVKLPPELWWEEYAGPVTDIADAYFLARMLYKELVVRSGKLTLYDLDEGERRIFLRVTKAYPVNILDRSFINI